MLQRRAKRRTGWAAFLAVILLVMPVAVAAEACVLASIAAQAASQSGCASMPTERAACLARCIGEHQASPSLDHPADVLPACELTDASQPQIDIEGFALAGKPLAVPRSPPLRILFCTYRT